jgi:hypothetical protein
MALKLKTEGVLKKESQEDGGQAVITEGLSFNTANSDEDNGMFVKIQSWDMDTEHVDLNRFLGHKVRITIEIID